MRRVLFIFSAQVALLVLTKVPAFCAGQAVPSQTTSRTEYEFPGSSWQAWESLGDGAKGSYSVFTRAVAGPSEPAVSLHLTCNGGRYDVFIRTSASVDSKPSQRYQQNLVEVQLRHFDEAVTKSYLFTPLEDAHGFYLYKALVSGDGPRQGIERLLGHKKTRVEFSSRDGGSVTALLDLDQMGRLYETLQTACRSGRPMGRIEPRLRASGEPPAETLADPDESATEPEEEPAQTAQPSPGAPAEAASASMLSVFGLSMGLELEEVARRTRDAPVPVPQQPGLYALPRVPAPNPDFEIYLALIRPEAGLCEIRAVGREIHSDPGGTAIRHLFHNNVSLLHKLFGPYRLVDPESADPQTGSADWMERLNKGQTRLLAEWSRARESHLGEDLDKIVLAVRAESDVKARLYLQVTFSNFSRAGITRP